MTLSMHPLNRDSQIALYRQLKDWILGEIERGGWATGALLPSERVLVAELGVSRITVRQALRELVQEGVLESVPGKGFFVVERPSFPLHGLVSLTALAGERGARVANRVLVARQVTASATLARGLGVNVGTGLVYVSRVRLLDGVPMCVQNLWLPEHRCPGLLEEDLERASIFALLTGRFGIELAWAEVTIGARIADANERRLLQLGVGLPVLTVDQRTLDRSGEAVEYSLSAHHPGRFPVTLVQDREGTTRVRAGAGDSHNHVRKAQ